MIFQSNIKITRPEQYIVFKHSGCWFRYQMIEKTGVVIYRNSYKAKSNYREFTLSNGICKSSLKIIDNKIIHEQIGKRKKIIVRELFKTHMVVTKTVDDIVTLKKFYRAFDTQTMSFC
ncbi:hypothetical protein PVAND_015417 [Polypedilum vanderplanki]|uniref:Uncharacterized protein n=1 Tax=Polypedilum vanderplanki TaxID=319348 RepID=A0A9J6BCJ4_POLVA|nr:hypothetical protein PVAND_015417 [Polypedilum vanderplanki]